MPRPLLPDSIKTAICAAKAADPELTVNDLSQRFGVPYSQAFYCIQGGHHLPREARIDAVWKAAWPERTRRGGVL